MDGILIPGGFGMRGIEGKIEAIRFARDYNLASTNKDEFILDLFKRLEADGK